MPISAKDFSAILDIMEELYRLQDLDSFTETAMRLVPPLVESDLTSFNEVNYEARRMRCLLDSPEAQRFYHQNQVGIETIMHQNPLIAHYADTHDEPKKVSDFLSIQEWQQTKIYQDFYRHVRANYQMSMALPLEAETIVAFAFNREKSDFTERHRAILSALQPHLVRAYENATAHSQTISRMESREDMLAARGAGWLDLDANLQILRAAPQTLETIAAFHPDEPPRPGRLPRLLETWVMNQRAHNQPSPRVLTSENRRLILRLIRSRRTQDISLVTEVFQLSTSPELLKELGLTKRQADILYWVSQGKANAEIAIILKISLSTVENHIHRILKSLELKNRTEAAQLAQTQITRFTMTPKGA